MDTRLIRYYKKQLYGGRSMVARFMDYVMLRLMLLFTLFIILLNFSRSIKVSLLIALFITLAVSFALTAIRSRRIRRFIERDIVRIKQKCLLEELTMMSTDEYAEFISQLFNGLSEISPTETGFIAKKDGTQYYVFHNHPSMKSNVDDILRVYRQYRGQHIIIISLSDFSEAAKTFGAGQDISLVSGENVLKMAADKNILPDEEAAKQRAQKEMSDTIVSFDKLKQTAFNKTKVRAYILCGLVIMCWSFVIGFRIYYPIIAVFCFVMAAVTFRWNKSHEESHGIGIS